MSDDLISRSDVLDYINDHSNGFKSYSEYSCAFDYFDTLPSADRPQGEWVDVNGDGSLWRCDQCKDTACCKGNFCPNCGAKMKGSDDEH